VRPALASPRLDGGPSSSRPELAVLDGNVYCATVTGLPGVIATGAKLENCRVASPSLASAPPVSTSGERGDATLGIGVSAKARGPSVGPIAGAIVPAWRCADELITVVMGFLCHLHDHG
jgi:hypothetical protein